MVRRVHAADFALTLVRHHVVEMPSRGLRVAVRVTRLVYFSYISCVVLRVLGQNAIIHRAHKLRINLLRLMDPSGPTFRISRYLLTHLLVDSLVHLLDILRNVELRLRRRCLLVRRVLTLQLGQNMKLIDGLHQLLALLLLDAVGHLHRPALLGQGALLARLALHVGQLALLLLENVVEVLVIQLFLVFHFKSKSPELVGRSDPLRPVVHLREVKN